ncbi:MAG: hypothetical protein Q4B40_00520 [Clostridia bacterium]|nr:hypothetical protein [Clostridia bacterium]
MKKLFALVLCIALIFTCFTGCHGKGEIAVTVGDVEFTSGYYACALLFADMEARSTVEAELSEEETQTTDIDYYSQKIDKKDYVEWVKDTALDTIKELGAIKSLCKKAEIKLSDEIISTADSNAEYLWDSYGYSVIMEENGVSEATFKAYMQDTYLMDEYFNHIYGKGGEKEVAADKVAKQLVEDYVLVNTLDQSFEGLQDDEIKEKREQFTAFETALKNGTKTFEQVLTEHEGGEAHNHEHSEDASAPQDAHATALTETDANFETAKKMAVGEVKLITKDDDAGITILVKKDISADPYYLENYDSTLRHSIVGDEFEDDIEDYTKKLDVEVNDFAVDRFKVKKLIYPEQQQAAQPVAQ